MGPSSPRARTPARFNSRTSLRSRCALRTSGRRLDPIERTCEILFGVIVVLTFTGSISVADPREDTWTVLVAAIACNLAWGIVDAVMYVIASFSERARAAATIRAIRSANSDGTARHLIRGALPSAVSTVMTPDEIDGLRLRLLDLPQVPAEASLKASDFLGGFGVFLLVF